MTQEKLTRIIFKTLQDFDDETMIENKKWISNKIALNIKNEEFILDMPSINIGGR